MRNKNVEQINKDDTKEEKKGSKKQKITIKEIGLERLVIMFLCGVFLIVLSIPDLFHTNKKSGNISSKTNRVTSTSTKVSDSNQDSLEEYTDKLEAKLKNILKKVHGIGNVEVMITLKASKEQVALKDSPYTQDSINETDGEGGNRINQNINKEDKTVLVTEGDGDSLPYIIKEIEPEIEGILVIAEGGGNENVNNEIIDAVEVLFDVPIHKIKVMKMN